ncbi:MAG: hypothetical protein JWO98_4517 [Frankiales bacterium]|nr:hypothetical protein [Frankiales bacterium]
MRADLSSPARDLVEEMQRGDWADDPYFKSPPDEDQIHDVAKLLAELQTMVDYGRPSRPSAVRHLRDGVWELKYSVRRFVYFDTPGDGTYEPKVPVQDGHNLPIGQQDEFWQYPLMDEVLRLTNGFSKTGQKAPPEQIDLAIVIRDEDVQHDR